MLAGFAALALVGTSITSTRAAGIQALGDQRLRPLALSDDGTTVVGRMGVDAGEGFRWTREGGVQTVGLVPGTGWSEAYDVSADGSVVGGHSQYRPFRWTEGSGLRPTGFEGTGYGLSGDGRFLVGAFDTGMAYRWSDPGGLQPLGMLPGFGQSVATAASFSGSVIVGEANNGAEHTKGWRWTSSGGMRDIGRLPGSDGGVSPNAVSADGTIIVGTAGGAPEPGNDYNYRAFAWTEVAGMRDLGRLPGMLGSWATDVSADGSTVVGYSFAAGSHGRRTGAFLWTEAGGMRDLRQVLVEAGVDLTGWGELSTAEGVSADGLTITGIGSLGAYIAVVPEPSTAAAVLVCFPALMRRRRCHQLREGPGAVATTTVVEEAVV